jgi:hypothetical protein
LPDNLKAVSDDEMKDIDQKDDSESDTIQILDK